MMILINVVKTLTIKLTRANLRIPIEFGMF